MGSEEGYNKESENDNISDLYGDLEILLVSILQCKRKENIIIQIKMNVKYQHKNQLMQEKKMEELILYF